MPIAESFRALWRSLSGSVRLSITLITIGTVLVFPLDWIDSALNVGSSGVAVLGDLVFGSIAMGVSFLVEGIASSIAELFNQIGGIMNGLIPGSPFNTNNSATVSTWIWTPIGTTTVNIFADGQTLLGFLLGQFGVTLPL